MRPTLLNVVRHSGRQRRRTVSPAMRSISSSTIVTIPRLSPSITKARVHRRLVRSGTYVSEYDPVLILECSPDLIADPADRLTSNHRPKMLIECLEEGVLRWKEPQNPSAADDDKNDDLWLDIGTILGEVIETDPSNLDENGGERTEAKIPANQEVTAAATAVEWTWQAYLHNEEDDDI